MRKITLVCSSVLLTTITFFTSCEKKDSKTSATITSVSKMSIKSGVDYTSEMKQAATVHNAYLDYMYNKCLTGELTTERTPDNFNKAMELTNEYYISNKITTTDGWDGLTVLLNNWNQSGQKIVDFSNQYVQENASPAFISYSNQINDLLSSMDMDFIVKSNNIFTTALRAGDLTDIELDGLANAIGVAQGSFSYWTTDDNISKWTEITGGEVVPERWGALAAADGGGALAGCAYGAWCGPLGAGAGAVGAAAFFSAACILDWD